MIKSVNKLMLVVLLGVSMAVNAAQPEDMAAVAKAASEGAAAGASRAIAANPDSNNNGLAPYAFAAVIAVGSWIGKDIYDWAKGYISGENSTKAIQVKSIYAKGLAKSPRPSLLLNEPLPLPKANLQKMQMMSRIPIERIESAWWDWKEQEHKNRDYYFALSGEGQMLWVYQDRMSKQYYLHGYFD